MLPRRDAPPGALRARLITLEAALLLAWARLLVDWRALSGWRNRLGPMVNTPTQGAGADWGSRYLARAVERAAGRLPFTTKCLPRAIALHLMLARRGAESQLVLAVLPGLARGKVDDLHAWIEAGGEVLIGATPLPYRAIARFALAH